MDYSNPYTNHGEGKGEEVDDKQEPVTAIVPRVWEKYPGQTWRGLQLPVMTSEPYERLGNVMGQYATLYALGRAYNVTVRLSPQMMFRLSKTFPYLTMPHLPGIFIRKYWTPIHVVSFRNYAKAEAAAAGLLGPRLFLLDEWPFEIQLFNAYRREILKELTFSPEVMKEVHHFISDELGKVTKNKTETPVLVGVHVRRTDYVEYIKRMFQGHVPEKAYFERAMAYYRKKHTNVIFMVGSDDMPYVKQHFGNLSDVFFTPGSTQEIDMAALASCNHSIISLGSFGFWTGYLSGGEVLYPNISFGIPYHFSQDWYNLARLDFFTPIAED